MARTLTVLFEGDSKGLSKAADAATKDMQKVTREAGQMGEKFGNAASQSAQAAGGLGDLGGALSGMGGPLGGIGKGMEALGPSIMGVTGAADLAELASSKLNLAQIKTTVSAVASRAANVAGAAATAVMTGAQWALNAAMSANPIALVVIALVLLVAAIVIAWKNSETFREIVTGAFNAVLGAVMFLWHWIADNWPLILAILTGPIGLAVLAIVKNWDSITAGFESVVNGIKGGVDKVVGFVTGLPGMIASVGGRMLDAGKSLAGQFLSGLGSLADAVGDGIVTGLKAAVNATVIKPINAAIGLINSKLISAANKIPFVDIPNIKPIPELAKGGIVSSATLALIGEAGPEAVIPLSRLGGLGGNTIINVSMTIPVGANPIEGGRAIVDLIRAYAKGTGQTLVIS